MVPLVPSAAPLVHLVPLVPSVAPLVHLVPLVPLVPLVHPGHAAGEVGYDGGRLLPELGHASTATPEAATAATAASEAATAAAAATAATATGCHWLPLPSTRPLRATGAGGVASTSVSGESMTSSPGTLVWLLVPLVPLVGRLVPLVLAPLAQLDSA